MSFIRNIPKTALVLIIFVLFIIVAVSLLLGGKVKTPSSQNLPLPTVIPSPKIALPPGVPKTTLRTISYQLPNTELPQSAAVYKVAAYGVDKNWASDVASSFGLTSPPTTSSDNQHNTILTWADETGDQLLLITLELGYVEYTNNAPQLKRDLGASPPPTIDQVGQAATIAQNFLKKHTLLAPNLIPRLSDTQYFISSSTHLQQTKNFTSANLFVISFVRQVDGHDVYQQFANIAQATVWVDKYQKVKKLTFAYPILSDQTKRTAALLSLTEAKTKLEAGEGTIVNFNPGEPDIKATTDPKSATLTKVSVSYFDDRTTGILQPILVFEGKASYSINGPQDQPIVIYLPALK